MSLKEVSPNAEIVDKAAARQVNVAASIGLQQVLKTNLGPKGTLKMLVGGAGQIKLTKDGNVLLKEMQIQHPTAQMIARTSTAQDDVTGDGTTSTVLLCGELLKQADRYISEGLHPRIITDGYDIARDSVVNFLDKYKINKPNLSEDRELLNSIASTSLQTKLDYELSCKMTSAIVDAIQCIANSSNTNTTDVEENIETNNSNNDNSNNKENGHTGKNNDDAAIGKENGSSNNTEKEEDVTTIDKDNNNNNNKNNKKKQLLQPIDLNMIEIMTMQRQMGTDSKFINGLVLDHGGRHPDMPKILTNCYIMTCNVTFEYEQTEVQSGFVYSKAEEREKLVESERKWLDERCKAVVDFKRSVCKDGENFVIINQKGIDPLSLDIFAKEGILALRRAKRRNMERLCKACGGTPIHSVEDLDKSDLGYAGKVSEATVGEDKFTFVEECKYPKSCTLLLQGPNIHTIDMIKDATRDGLRAIKNAIEDHSIIPGAGAFEIAAASYLRNNILKKTKGRAKLGIEAFAESLLIIPKTLAENSGFDVQDTILKLTEEYESSVDEDDEKSNNNNVGLGIGLDIQTGEPIVSIDEGIYDNVRVKRQSLYLSTVLANQLLLVDEVMRAGKNRGKPSGIE